MFEPRTEPAKSLYEALVEEMSKRHGRPLDEWMSAERSAIHECARRLAPSLGLREPTLKEVLVAETLACGHVDYASKFAYGVADAMRGTL